MLYLKIKFHPCVSFTLETMSQIVIVSLNGFDKIQLAADIGNDLQSVNRVKLFVNVNASKTELLFINLLKESFLNSIRMAVANLLLVQRNGSSRPHVFK